LKQSIVSETFQYNKQKHDIDDKMMDGIGNIQTNTREQNKDFEICLQTTILSSIK
jgi:hypothetical protein